MTSIIDNFLARILEKKQKIDSFRPIRHDIEKEIFDQLRLDWNYHSNHMEGNTLTYWETKMLLLFGITSSGKPFRDSLEMMGHNEALNWVLDIVKESYPLTETFIRELHIKILKEPYESPAITPEWIKTFRVITPGIYKQMPNHVRTATGEIFRFAEPFETPAMMWDLIEWYRWEKEKWEIHPVILATEFHYRFIRIHPFDDGNGRTARILMNFILLSYGYPPAIVKTEEKSEYLYALRQADIGEMNAFYQYMIEKVEESLDIILSIVSKKSNIQ